jgi:hypothetical protein
MYTTSSLQETANNQPHSLSQKQFIKTHFVTQWHMVNYAKAVLPVVSLSCIQCTRLPQLPSWAPHPALAQSATIMLEGQDTTHSHESGYAPNMVRVWSTQISKLCCLVESKITCLSTVKTQKTVQNSRENDFNLIRETLMKCKHQDWLALEIYTRFSYLQSANGRSAWMVSKELFVISQICKV